MSYDMTVVLTAHSESVIAGRTLTAAEKSIRMAEENGLSVEKLIVLDNPTPDAFEYFHNMPFEGWNIEQVAHRDPGLTRNSGAALARGKYTAFLDADDLFSANWLTHAHRHAEDMLTENKTPVVYPELLWFFEHEKGSKLLLPQDHRFSDPGLFLANFPYDSLCFTSTDLIRQIPNKPREIDKGYAYEDFQWMLLLYCAGAFHTVAKNTVIFKRRRLMSVNVEANQRDSLLPLIEGLTLEDIKAYRELHQQQASNP